MGKKKLLFSQKEMRSFRVRFQRSKEQLFQESLGLDKKSLEDRLARWGAEKEERRMNSKLLRQEERARQLDLFPEEKEKSLWRKSIKEMSATKLSTYRGCALAFLYNYILHLKVPQPPAKIFGKEIHYMLQSFYDMNFKSVDSFVGFWKHRWWGVVNGKYSDVAIKFRDKGEAGYFCGLGTRILNPFYEHFKKLPKPDMWEYDFSKNNLTVDGIKLVGKWDRVDTIEGEPFITDYKTDRFSPAENTFLLHRLPQFTFYALAWKLKKEKEGKKGEEIPHLAMLHLRSGQTFKTRRTEDDFSYIKDVITKTKERILAGDFTPFYGFHCKICDFYDSECRRRCIRVGSKLKTLEEALNTEPELLNIFCYNVPETTPRTPLFNEYLRKGDYINACRSLKEDLHNVHCPLEIKQGSLACLMLDEESPIRVPEPEDLHQNP